MQHKTLDATTTATDQGAFTAIAAAYTVDRQKEQIKPGAFAKTIAAWQGSGKRIPLHWDHLGDPKNIIGTVDPSAMRETDQGLYVEGNLDLENSDQAREVWRLVKADSISLSFGYIVNDGFKRKDGVAELTELDLFEVSLTPAPANADTRLLSWKSAKQQGDMPGTVDNLMARMRELMRGDPPSPEAMLAFARRIMSDLGKSGGQSAFKVVELDAETLIYPDGVETKAVWTAAYVNDLPDSAFLYVESGGDKDPEGKTTPRNLRHFPYKDADGNVDLPHLRNALARIPQSSLPQDVKDRLTAKAQSILDNQKAIEDADGEEPLGAKPTAQDPLRTQQAKLEYELATAGLDLREPPKVKEQPKPEPPSLEELRREHSDLMLQILTGSE